MAQSEISITKQRVGDDGEVRFCAICFNTSRSFKTRAGAVRWLARCGYSVEAV